MVKLVVACSSGGPDHVAVTGYSPGGRSSEVAQLAARSVTSATHRVVEPDANVTVLAASLTGRSLADSSMIVPYGPDDGVAAAVKSEAVVTCWSSGSDVAGAKAALPL